MSCDEFEVLISGYLDEELSAEQRERLEAHLRTCSACRDELASLRTLKENLAMMKFPEPTDAELDKYWARVYSRLERGVAWVLLSLGVMILIGYGAWRFLRGFLLDARVPLVLRIGVGAAVLGAVILGVSLLRERLAVRKVDKYSKEIER